MMDPFEVFDGEGADPFGYQTPGEAREMASKIGKKFCRIAKNIAKKRGTTVKAVRRAWGKKAAKKR